MNFESADKTLMFLRKSFEVNGKLIIFFWKPRKLLLKAIFRCPRKQNGNLPWPLPFVTCNCLSVGFKLFFLTRASQYPRILWTVESSRFFKKKSKTKTSIYLFQLKMEILLDNFNNGQSVKMICSCQLSWWCKLAMITPEIVKFVLQSSGQTGRHANWFMQISHMPLVYFASR